MSSADEASPVARRASSRTRNAQFERFTFGAAHALYATSCSASREKHHGAVDRVYPDDSDTDAEGEAERYYATTITKSAAAKSNKRPRVATSDTATCPSVQVPKRPRPDGHGARADATRPAASNTKKKARPATSAFDMAGYFGVQTRTLLEKVR